MQIRGKCATMREKLSREREGEREFLASPVAFLVLCAVSPVLVKERGGGEESWISQSST